MNNKKYPQFPLYIPSKGRSQYMMTSKSLALMGVEHYVIVEPQELEDYKRAIKDLPVTILELDLSYKSNYELLDNFGLEKSTGPGPARNFAWDHSVKNGFAYHWVMDDNIRCFYRFNRNLKVPAESPAIWKAMEDFILRYKNVGMAGPNYEMFVPRKSKLPPFVYNTRIYSCNLIRNDVPFRWRGRYNEDTILSLDMLSNGWCTIQFNAFLQDKMPTQVLKGGNTQEFYHKEGKVQPGEKYADTGTIAKSKMMVQVYPEISKMVWKFNRWHHHVDYRKFKRLKPIKRDNIEIKTGVDDYGMKLIHK